MLAILILACAIIVLMATVQVNLLGGFDVMRDGVSVEGFRSDKARALLAYLVVEHDRIHQRMALANLLWSEFDEQSARTSLRATLYNLRQIIDAPAKAICFTRFLTTTINGPSVPHTHPDAARTDGRDPVDVFQRLAHCAFGR